MQDFKLSQDFTYKDGTVLKKGDTVKGEKGIMTDSQFIPNSSIEFNTLQKWGWIVGISLSFYLILYYTQKEN